PLSSLLTRCPFRLWRFRLPVDWRLQVAGTFVSCMQRYRVRPSASVEGAQCLSIKASWDIFCVVVDNYGDIGVTWRLARQMVSEHEQRVRLWVDDLNTFARLCPGTSAEADRQWHEGVEVCHWTRDWPGAEPADVVIEAFACELPPDYIAAMADSGKRILWLNLEYLSAEDWVVGCHALPSMQPHGLQKYFFFPGFEQGTG